MTVGRVRALVLGLCAVLAVAALVSCARGNSQDTTTSPAGLPKFYAAADLLTAVTARQRSDRTASLQLTGEVAEAAGQPVAVGGQGALRVDTGGVATQFTQTLTTPGKAPASATYLVLPGGQVWRQAGPGWSRVDQAATGTADKVLATMAANLAGGADPTANLARYENAALVADAVDDAVDGTPAVKYLLVVDLTRAADLERDPAVKAALQAQTAAGLTRISSTLWIDADSRPLRSETRQALPGIGTLTLTADYRDWGRPVTIATPTPVP